VGCLAEVRVCLLIMGMAGMSSSSEEFLISCLHYLLLMEQLGCGCPLFEIGGTLRMERTTREIAVTTE
jgi:hypothetical protein